MRCAEQALLEFYRIGKQVHLLGMLIHNVERDYHDVFKAHMQRVVNFCINTSSDGKVQLRDPQLKRKLGTVAKQYSYQSAM